MSDRASGQSFLIRDSIANLIRVGSLMAIALGLFAIACGGLAVYLNLSAQLEFERADRAAARQADRIAAELSKIQTSLRDASVVDAARSGSGDSVRSALRGRGVVNILDARILPASINDIAVDEDLDLGFTATEMVLEAIRNERAQMRALEPGTPAESLAFAQRLPGDSGVLLLRLTVSVATRLLEAPEALDFVALAQHERSGPTVLSAAGRSTAARIRSTPVAGSALTLQWSRAVTAAPLGNRAAIILGCVGIIVLMTGLLLRRRTRLARYLAHKEPAAEPLPTKRTALDRTAPRRAAIDDPPTVATMVLDGNDDKAQQVRKSGKPPECSVRGAELPEWLQSADGFDPEELGPDEATLESARPLPDTPVQHEASEANEALLEELDDYQGVDPDLFAADGIHGLAGKELGVPAAVMLGLAIGSEANERGLRRICLAHDGRKSGPELIDSLIQGLSVSGIDAINLDAVPAPVAWFAAFRMQQTGAVVVTGGERPEEVNGLEIVFDDEWLDAEARQRLLERIREQDFTSGAGKHRDGNEAESYGQQLAAELRLEQPLRVVLDCGNAVNGALAPKLFEALGVDVIPLNADAETNAAEIAGFSGAEREQDLKLCVDNFAADLGIAFDRTASRLHVVGPEGAAVDMARIMTFLMDDLAAHSQKVTVVVDSDLAARLAATSNTNARIIACDGDAMTVQKTLRACGGALGAHSDGSVCLAQNWHGLPDAFRAAAWLLSVLAADGTPLPELLASLDGTPDPVRCRT